MDREIAQLIGALRAAGVSTVECCADGWGSGMAYVIVETVDDLQRAAVALSCRLPAEVFERAATAVPEWTQSLGPWWPIAEGWAVGFVTEPGGGRPALAWPANLTEALTAVAQLAAGVAPLRLRRVPWRTRLARR